MNVKIWQVTASSVRDVHRICDHIEENAGIPWTQLHAFSSISETFNRYYLVWDNPHSEYLQQITQILQSYDATEQTHNAFVRNEFRKYKKRMFMINFFRRIGTVQEWFRQFSRRK